MNNRVLFIAAASSGSKGELYSSDGTTTGTVDLQVDSLQRDPRNFVQDGSTLVYEVSTAVINNQPDLVRTDGTLWGAVLVGGARIIDRQLRVYGTNAAEYIQLFNAGGVTSVTSDGQLPLMFNESQFDNIVVYALGGDDTVDMTVRCRPPHKCMVESARIR